MKSVQKPMEGGRWKIYRQPSEKQHYVVSVDAASGKEGANESVVNVLSIEKGEQCAIFGGLYDPEIVSREAEKIGYMFNTAVIAVELEFHGATIVNNLRGWGYPNLYFHTESLTGMGGMTTRNYGWDARRFRQTAIDWLQQDVGNILSTKPADKKTALKIYDHDTINQLGYFIRNKSSGKMEAASGKYDDRVSALYIGNFVRRERLQLYTHVEEKPKEKNFLDILANRDNEDDLGSVGLGED